MKDKSKVTAISLPISLHKKLKESHINVSSVCQRALKEAYLQTQSKNDQDADLAQFGANRLKKETFNKIDSLKTKCVHQGKIWAAKTASLDELVWVFENGDYGNFQVSENVKNAYKENGETWLLFSGKFGDETFNFLPDEILEFDKDNEMFWAFVDGAKLMWEKIKLKLNNHGE